MIDKLLRVSRTDQILSTALKVFVVLVMLVLLLFQTNKILTASLGYDDSYNASVAKNLSLGRGFITSYETVNPVRRFNPEITTGPVMLVPAALLMKSFGNTHWVPKAVGAFFNFTLLLIMLYVPRWLDLGPRQLWRYRALLLALILYCGFISVVGACRGQRRILYGSNRDAAAVRQLRHEIPLGISFGGVCARFGLYD
jgi:hypothetical protein